MWGQDEGPSNRWVDKYSKRAASEVKGQPAEWEGGRGEQIIFDKELISSIYKELM